MPVSVSHALSMTTPDDPAYENKPSNWNSAHAVSLNILATEISGLFSNANNVSFGMSGTAITASIAAAPSPVSFSAGTQSSALGAVTFANSNGVSFGLDAGTITATVATNYLTTARASNDAVGLNTALTAGPLAWTVDSRGISLNASSAAGTTSGFGGNQISGSMTHNTAGLNLSLNHPAWLTTAMASDAATISNIKVSAGAASANLSALTFSNSNGLAFGLNAGTITGSYTVPTVTNSSWTVSDAATSATVGRLAFTNANGVTMTLSTSNNGNHTVFASYNSTQFAGTGTTFAGTNLSASMTLNSAGLNLAMSGGGGGGGAAISAAGNSVSNGTVVFSNSNGISFGMNGSTITATVVPGAAAGIAALNNSNTTYTSGTVQFTEGGGAITIASDTGQRFAFSVPQTSSIVGTNGISISSNGSTISVQGMFKDRLVPWDYLPSLSVSSTGGIGTLHVFPFEVNTNLTFNQVNMIGSLSHATTTVPHTISATGSANSSIGFSYTATHTLSRFIDLYLFKRGTGGYSTEIETIGSTRNSFLTNGTYTHLVTYSVGATSASVTMKASYSYVVSVPSMTSGTMTSINAGSTITTFGPGYSSITGSTTQSSTSQTTNGSMSFSMAGLYPGTTGFVSNKMIPFAFASSLSAGQYWFGSVQSTSNSSSSSGSFNNTVAGNSMNTTINASVLTSMGSFSINGMSSTIASSLGWVGNASQATMAWLPGHGSFSATYASNTTYNNNLGNPAGAIGFNQINTNGSFWRPWLEFASNRI